MSVRAMPLKRPLDSRSRCTIAATSRPPSAGTARANGTTAMLIGSVTPDVMVRRSCASAGVAAAPQPTTGRSRVFSCVSLWLEYQDQVPIEQTGIGRRRQWRGAIDRGFDRFAQRGVAAAATIDPDGRDLAARNLGDRHSTRNAGLCRGWLDPGALDARDDLRRASETLRRSCVGHCRVLPLPCCAGVQPRAPDAPSPRRPSSRRQHPPRASSRAPSCRRPPSPRRLFRRRPRRRLLLGLELLGLFALFELDRLFLGLLAQLLCFPARAFPAASRSSSRRRSTSAGSGFGGPCSSGGGGSGTGSGAGSGRRFRLRRHRLGFGAWFDALQRALVDDGRFDRERSGGGGSMFVDEPADTAAPTIRPRARAWTARQRANHPSSTAYRNAGASWISGLASVPGGCVTKPTLLAPARCRMRHRGNDFSIGDAIVAAHEHGGFRAHGAAPPRLPLRPPRHRGVHPAVRVVVEEEPAAAHRC